MRAVLMLAFVISIYDAVQSADHVVLYNKGGESNTKLPSIATATITNAPNFSINLRI